MELKIGDMVELKNGSIVKITFVGSSLDCEIVYATGDGPVTAIPYENIVKKIES